MICLSNSLEEVDCILDRLDVIDHQVSLAVTLVELAASGMGSIEVDDSFEDLALEIIVVA